jgi:dolichol kinase
MPDAMLLVPAAAVIAGDAFPPADGAGTGATAAAGMYLYAVVSAAAMGVLEPVSIGALLLTGSLIYFATHSDEVAGVAAFGFALVTGAVELVPGSGHERGLGWASLLTMSLAAIAFASVLGSVLNRGTLRLRAHASAKKVEIKGWRLAARPLALLFLVIDGLWGRRLLLLVMGGVTIAFCLTDLARIAARRSIATIFKASEVKRFSSMTYFLVSVFITFLAFPGAIAYLPLVFTTVGDLFGKVVGIRFGKTILYKGKTLEGALGFLAGSLMTGYVIARISPLPLAFVVCGSVFAVFVELFSDRLDDNFSVSLLSGGFLYALRYFLKI